MNKVYLNGIEIEKYDDLKQFKLTIYGDNNVIYLNDFNGNALVYIYIDGNNCEFSFGKNNTVRNDIGINFWDTTPLKPFGGKIIIGDNNFFNGSNISFISPLNSQIVIGNGNLFAGDLLFWGRNDHIMYDLRSKKRLNVDHDIIIGDSNWICQKCSFLPGGQILNNNVVGFGSLVNKKIKTSNCLIAGVPVKIKKRRINWSRSSDINLVDFENCLNVKDKG